MLERRVVIDTNVWVSYFFWSKSGVIVELCDGVWGSQTEAIVSFNTLREYYKKIVYAPWRTELTVEDRYAMFERVRLRSRLIEPNLTVDFAPHEEDNCFLELAIGGKADFLITGDKGLLALDERMREEYGVAVLTPRDYLDQ